MDDALRYHSQPVPGKIYTGVSKPCSTQADLALAYTPGIADVCLEIANDKENSWKYTSKGNTVAVITDGTAVLGLGNIGPDAALPVMEGKIVLFKKFAGIDGVPLCYDMAGFNSDDLIENFVNCVKPLQPSFAGINLEDIKAPLCFEIQERLDKAMDIPVFHDDQDGTAIIILSGLINSLKLTGKKFAEVKIVVNGAGAAGISCSRLLLQYGVSKEQIFLCDSKGLITSDRPDLNDYKIEFAQNIDATDLTGAIKNADIFIGVSGANLLSKDMIRAMKKDPIIFAVANPIPEIMPEDAYEAGAYIVATGRSDYPNQVNNALCFPGLFRGVFDCRASTVNLQMKIAAAEAIASLASEPMSDDVKSVLTEAYPEEAKSGAFNSVQPLTENYIIPKLFDLRIVPKVAKKVAQAAMETGVAKIQIADLEEYEKKLLLSLNPK